MVTRRRSNNKSPAYARPLGLTSYGSTAARIARIATTAQLFLELLDVSVTLC